MDIVYASDDNYSWLAGISMLSLLENCQGNHNFYILDDYISDENKKKMEEVVCRYNGRIEFIPMNDLLSKLVNNGVTGYEATENMNITSYSRLFVSDILPKEIEKVIYLDCDTLIISDFQKSYDSINMQKALALSEDCIINDYKHYINFPPKDKYYNAGVMIMNLNMWRKNNCTTLFFEHIKNVRASYPLVDQDIINVSLHEHIQAISEAGINCLSQMFLYNYKHYKWVYKLNNVDWMSKEKFVNSVDNPKILHFSGQTFGRPWYINSYHPYRDAWLKYYEMSPWNNRKLETINLSIPYKVQLFFYQYFPRSVGALIGGVMQRVFYWSNYK